jgi:hypothetical protein
VAKIAFFSPFTRTISFSRTLLLLRVIEPTGMPEGGWRVEARQDRTIEASTALATLDLMYRISRPVDDRQTLRMLRYLNSPGSMYRENICLL